MEEEKYMERAIELAWKGCGFVNPNPMVGAVIVKDGAIIGEGYHERYGGLHAERNALKNCTVSPRGAVLYVTLEPCCHYGKTPPCTEAILESGISKVVVGTQDPNPRMAGKSIRLLREKGISVDVGLMEDKCRELIRPFSKFIRTGVPYVLMKYAMTMDGKISAHTGNAKWITDKEARLHAQRQRLRCSAIMVGVNTVIEDDPLLTCRLENGRDPVRVICDTRLRTPLSSKIVRSARETQTILAAVSPEAERRRLYEEQGVKILELPEKDGHVDLRALMSRLGREGIDSILLEGGSTLNWSAVRQGIVDEVHTYIAPKLLGGTDSKTPVGGTGFDSPGDALPLRVKRVSRIGEDWLMESEVLKECLPEL